MNLFVTFEGIDGSGKTTQLRLLQEHLLKRGIDTVIAREPGGTEVGEAIRQILLHSGTQELKPLSELLLYYASRHQNLCQNILPALERGQWVLCDRYADASLAYQGYGRGLDLHFIEQLNQAVIGQRLPNLTFLMDLDPAVALARARQRDQGRVVDEGRFEMESLNFFERVRQGYLTIARDHAERFRLVSGNLSAEEAHQEILRLLCDFQRKDAADAI
ncbi:MAG TPA: dTMP kinase [Terriglobia bacterium]|nr:dTMP kinase [Terriglobia bacterium]